VVLERLGHRLDRQTKPRLGLFVLCWRSAHAWRRGRGTGQGDGRPSARVNNDNEPMMKISGAWPVDLNTSLTDWPKPTGEKKIPECAWRELPDATEKTALPTPNVREPYLCLQFLYSIAY